MNTILIRHFTADVDYCTEHRRPCSFQRFPTFGIISSWEPKKCVQINKNKHSNRQPNGKQKQFSSFLCSLGFFRFDIKDITNGKVLRVLLIRFCIVAMLANNCVNLIVCAQIKAAAAAADLNFFYVIYRFDATEIVQLHVIWSTINLKEKLLKNNSRAATKASPQMKVKPTCGKTKCKQKNRREEK